MLNLFLALAMLAGPAGSTGPVVRDRTISSLEKPRITIEVAAPFQYIGHVPFQLGNVAKGERIVFADIDGNRVKRLFVAQFEEFLPESTEVYRYSFENAREIGGHRFRHNTGGYSDSRLRKEHPGNEAAAMFDFLVSKGLEVDDELLMSRFVTLGSEDRRSELILFYIENARDHGLSVEALTAENSRWQEVKEGLVSRSELAFRVIPD